MTVYLSPCLSSCLFLPSKDTHAVLRLSGETVTWNHRNKRNPFIYRVGITKSRGYFTLSSTPAGTTIGLNDSEWGQMGVIMIAGTDGWIIEAPAATA